MPASLAAADSPAGAYTVQTYQSWCGHTQEIIPFPRADGSVRFIDVIGEAR